VTGAILVALPTSCALLVGSVDGTRVFDAGDNDVRHDAAHMDDHASLHDARHTTDHESAHDASDAATDAPKDSANDALTDVATDADAVPPNG
jgi:hypothetical protein